MGSGVSSRLMVTLVRAVSFIVALTLTEMLDRPNRDGPSTEKKKHNTRVFTAGIHDFYSVLHNEG